MVYGLESSKSFPGFSYFWDAPTPASYFDHHYSDYSNLFTIIFWQKLLLAMLPVRLHKLPLSKVKSKTDQSIINEYKDNTYRENVNETDTKKSMNSFFSKKTNY